MEGDIIKRTLVYAAALGLAATAAQADWDGWYGGLSAGYLWGDVSHAFDNGAPGGDSAPSGGLLGGFVGYDFQKNNTVYGVELGGEFGNADGLYNEPAAATSSGSSDVNGLVQLRGRVGVVQPMGQKDALFFLTGGFATADMDFTGGPLGDFANKSSDWMNGWTVGLGVEVEMSDRAKLRFEYSYYDLGSRSGALPPNFPAVTMHNDVKHHVIRVAYRIDF